MVTQEDIDKFDHVIPQDTAGKALDWITNKRGMLVWSSIDLGKPGAVVITPVWDVEADKPARRPAYWLAQEPSKTITDVARVGVAILKEVKRFRVALRISGNGLSLKLTAASNDKLNKALAKAGPFSTYNFDYDTQEAVVLATTEIVGLDTLWLAGVI